MKCIQSSSNQVGTIQNYWMPFEFGSIEISSIQFKASQNYSSQLTSVQSDPEQCPHARGTVQGLCWRSVLESISIKWNAFTPTRLISIQFNSKQFKSYSMQLTSVQFNWNSSLLVVTILKFGCRRNRCCSQTVAKWNRTKWTETAQNEMKQNN